MVHRLTFALVLMHAWCVIADAPNAPLAQTAIDISAIGQKCPGLDTTRLEKLLENSERQTAELIRLHQASVEHGKQAAESVQVLKDIIVALVEAQAEAQENEGQRINNLIKQRNKKNERPWYRKAADGTITFTTHVLLPVIKHQLIVMLAHKVVHVGFRTTDRITGDFVEKVCSESISKWVASRPSEWLQDMSKEQRDAALLKRKIEVDPAYHELKARNLSLKKEMVARLAKISLESENRELEDQQARWNQDHQDFGGHQGRSGLGFRPEAARASDVD